jgi:hypothetical protein
LSGTVQLCRQKQKPNIVVLPVEAVFMPTAMLGQVSMYLFGIWNEACMFNVLKMMSLAANSI